MARPRLTDTERTASTRADLTPEEKEGLRAAALAAGLSEAEYVRRRVSGHHVSSSLDHQAAAGIISELHRIGVNVNQLAKAANANGRVLPGLWESTAAEIQAALSKLERFLPE